MQHAITWPYYLVLVRVGRPDMRPGFEACVAFLDPFVVGQQLLALYKRRMGPDSNSGVTLYLLDRLGAYYVDAVLGVVLLAKGDLCVACGSGDENAVVCVGEVDFSTLIAVSRRVDAHRGAVCQDEIQALKLRKVENEGVVV